MAETLKLQVVTPYSLILAEEVSEVTIPASQGEIGVLPGHTQLVSTLDIGQLRYRGANAKGNIAIAGGFVEIADNNVVILAETGEIAAQIDSARAEAARERAEKELKRQDLSEDEFIRLKTALKRALNRLAVGRL